MSEETLQGSVWKVDDYDPYIVLTPTFYWKRHRIVLVMDSSGGIFEQTSEVVEGEQEL